MIEKDLQKLSAALNDLPKRATPTQVWAQIWAQVQAVSARPLPRWPVAVATSVMALLLMVSILGQGGGATPYWLANTAPAGARVAVLTPTPGFAVLLQSTLEVETPTQTFPVTNTQEPIAAPFPPG